MHRKKETLQETIENLRQANTTALTQAEQYLEDKPQDINDAIDKLNQKNLLQQQKMTADAKKASQVESLEYQIKTKDTEITDLNKQLDSSKSKNITLQQDLSNTQDERERIVQEQKSQHKTLQKAKDTIINDLKATNKSLSEQNTELQQQLDSLKQTQSSGEPSTLRRVSSSESTDDDDDFYTPTNSPTNSPRTSLT